MPDLSKPLEDLPTFLATISMVTDDELEIVRALTHAERKSPARYDPARQIFLRILSGDLTYEFGFAQAFKLADPIERDCAVSILRAAKGFLNRQVAARLESLPAMTSTLPNGFELKVGPLWIRHCDNPRVLVLHFWQTALSPRQLSAAGAVLRSALMTCRPQLLGLEIDFISVAIPERLDVRKFQNFGWKQLAPLDEMELLKFSQQIAGAWLAYRRIGPREIRRRPSQAGLFD